MSFETAIQLGKRIQEHISEHKLKEYNIGLHGGEPLLMSPKKIDELTTCIKNQTNKITPKNYQKLNGKKNQYKSPKKKFLRAFIYLGMVCHLMDERIKLKLIIGKINL